MKRIGYTVWNPREKRDIPNTNGFLLDVVTNGLWIVPAIVIRDEETGCHALFHATQGHKILISNVKGWLSKNEANA